MAVCSADGAIAAGPFHQRRRDLGRRAARDRLHELLHRRTVCLCTHGVDDRVRAAALGQLEKLARDRGIVAPLDDLGPVAARQLISLRDEVDADDALDAKVPGDSNAHLPDRPETVDRERASFRHVRVCHRLPGGREHVGEIEEALVGWAFRHFDRAVVRLWDAEILGLTPGDGSVELRVAEQGGAFVVLVHLGRLTLRLKPVVAHEAVAAGDVERHHDTIPRPDVRHLGADLFDDPHRLVPEDVSRFHVHREDAVEVQVRTADRRRGDPHDRIRRLLDHRIRNLIDPDVFGSVPDHCLHLVLLRDFGGRALSRGFRNIREPQRQGIPPRIAMRSILRRRSLSDHGRNDLRCRRNLSA